MGINREQTSSATTASDMMLELQAAPARADRESAMRVVKIFFGIWAAIALFAIVANAVSATTPATGKYSFTEFAKTDNFTVSIDTSTIHRQVDSDGDTLVGAVVRVVPKVPVPIEKNQVGTYINSIIAVCGHDGLIVVQSETFDPSGKPIETDTEMKPVLVAAPQTPGFKVYERLCAVPPGYNRDGPMGRNTLKWV